MQSKAIQAIRGMPDILPDQSAVWQHIERCVAEVVSNYGYREIRLPILERTELFRRSIGEVTDIVEKEMYSFSDRNGDQVTMRPEATAGVVRAALQHGLLEQGAQRLWYSGPMFRHERPQKGRQRQFHQVGVEAFGFDGPDIDAEVILLSARLWRRLGVFDRLVLELNSLGDIGARLRFRDALVAYLSDHIEQLDEDSRRRLTSNPLRILDSKNSATQALLDNAPALTDYLDEASAEHFGGLCRLLEANGIAYRLNPRLVRGLDYYSRTVFEWVTEDLGAQGAVCAGGRYDGLFEQLGAKAYPAVGFAIGIERLKMLVELNQDDWAAVAAPDVFLAATGADEARAAMRIAEQLRDAMPELSAVLHCGGGSLKSQMKRADRSGAQLCLLIGSEELAAGEVTVKILRGDGQQRVPEERLATILSGLLSPAGQGDTLVRE